MPKGKKEHKWKDYLEGNYKPEDPNNEQQYRFIIRRRAKRIMKDLKLILEKGSPSDLYMIFSEDEKEWKDTMFPVASRLLGVVSDYLPSEKEKMKKAGWLPANIKIIASSLKQNGIRFAMWKLLSNSGYRKKKAEMVGLGYLSNLSTKIM